MTEITNTKDYMSFFNDIKKDIQTARIRASLSVNKELILLYWRIGKGILEKQKELGWGSKVIEQLSQDLKHFFPDARGFSVTNIKYMRILAGRINSNEISPQAVDQIPWGHVRTLLDTFNDKELIFWYVKNIIEHGWSRNVLVMQIESHAHLRLGNAQTNFKQTLPKPTSDLAKELVKSSYNFEFLGLSDSALERDIEKGLIEHIRNFLLELGAGFSFMGSQYKLEVGGEDFYIDLLFYNVNLRCYFILELKADKFKPEYAGKLGFYKTAIDHEIKDDTDNPTIGLLLCQSSNGMMVEYCLKDTRKPIGVSEYKTGLSEDYKKFLPTQEQFQHLIDTLDEDIKEKK